MKKTLREAKARLNKVATKLNKMENPDKIAIGASAKEVQRWLDEIDAMLLEESKAQDDIEKQRE